MEPAREIQNEICRIIYQMCSAHGNLYATMKAILAKKGVECGSVRKPLPALVESDHGHCGRLRGPDRRGHCQILLMGCLRAQQEGRDYHENLSGRRL